MGGQVMKFAKVMFLGGIILCAGLAAQASTVTSSFNNFVYSYTVTPAPGEMLRAFHIYIPASECDASHYLNRVMPAGWFFDTVPEGDHCLITWWTEGDPLPEGVPTNFGYTHYCAPCCHSWYVSEPGTSDPYVAAVDDDSNHSEPCNIEPPFDELCGGPGLILAPIYPVAVPENAQTWGAIKSLYHAQ
jgi:hypothetical protein